VREAETARFSVIESCMRDGHVSWKDIAP